MDVPDRKALVNRVEAALARDPDCPYHLVRRAAAIQLQDDNEGPSLEDAEKALLAAHERAPRYIEAMGDLAHFYDHVFPEPTKARQFANSCLVEIERLREEMEEILRDNPASPSSNP